MQILITGGAGFLGSHLCERLWSEGHEIVCIDDFSTGRMENIQKLVNEPRFTLKRRDVFRFTAIEIDRIYNLACPASPVHYRKDPIRTMTTNVLGAMNVLDIAKSQNARILQASTSEVYGDPEQHPQKESYRGNVNPNGPRACYDEGKRAAETLICDYQRQYGVDAVIARIFNTYGPRMWENDGRVVSNFIGQALRGEPITIYGNGSQTRSFCYVDDLIDGLVALMESPLTIPTNLGNPQEITIGYLAKLIIEITGSKSEIVHKPLPTDDPARRCPDISRAENIGWKPHISLRNGLERTVEYFKGQIDRREIA